MRLVVILLILAVIVAALPRARLRAALGRSGWPTRAHRGRRLALSPLGGHGARRRRSSLRLVDPKPTQPGDRGRRRADEGDLADAGPRPASSTVAVVVASLVAGGRSSSASTTLAYKLMVELAARAVGEAAMAQEVVRRPHLLGLREQGEEEPRGADPARGPAGAVRRDPHPDGAGRRDGEGREADLASASSSRATSSSRWR